MAGWTGLVYHRGMDCVPERPISLVLVEDDDDFVQAFSTRARALSWLAPPAYAATLAEARCLPVRAGDVWVVDLGLPDGDGVELIPRLVAAGAQVLALTVFEDEAHVVAAIRAGAHGYHLKGDSHLFDAIRQVHAGDCPLSAKVAAYLLRRFREVPSGNVDGIDDANGHLSPREMQTLRALAHGYSYREVAVNHRVSRHTVGDHVKSIYRKLRVNSRTEAINQALKRGILSLDDV